MNLKYGSREIATSLRNDGRVAVGEREIAVVLHKDGSVRFPDRPGLVAWTASTADKRWVYLDGRVYEFEMLHRGARRKRAGSHHGSLTAPMPATVRTIAVAAGDRVARGDTLIILEAMKMELPVKAAAAGTVEAINCREGDLVRPGAALIELDEDD